MKTYIKSKTKIMKKRLTEILLVMTMILTMSGCGNDNSENKNNLDVVQDNISQGNDKKQNEDEKQVNKSPEISEKQNEDEQKTEKKLNEESINTNQKDLYYIIEGVFSLTQEYGKKVLVVGYPVNGSINTGMEMDIVTADGRITTTVLGIETVNGLKESCNEFEDAGILLDTDLRESVSEGDMLVVKGVGEKTGIISCFLTSLSEDSDVLADGMDVTVEIGLKRFVAKTNLIETYDDGTFAVYYELGSEISMVNGQVVKIFDDNENELAIGIAYPVRDNQEK